MSSEGYLSQAPRHGATVFQCALSGINMQTVLRIPRLCGGADELLGSVPTTGAKGRNVYPMVKFGEQSARSSLATIGSSRGCGTDLPYSGWLSQLGKLELSSSDPSSTSSNPSRI